MPPRRRLRSKVVRKIGAHPSTFIVRPSANCSRSRRRGGKFLARPGTLAPSGGSRMNSPRYRDRPVIQPLLALFGPQNFLFHAHRCEPYTPEQRHCAGHRNARRCVEPGSWHLRAYHLFENMTTCWLRFAKCGSETVNPSRDWRGAPFRLMSISAGPASSRPRLRGPQNPKL
jgi:hypothetical protein